MGVPAHDTRDFAYAKKYELPIKTVIAPPGWGGEELVEAYTGPGEMVNSGQFVGLGNEEGKQAVIQALEESGAGGGTVSYRIRDWLISRQRYWGAPIPMVYCDACGIVPIPEDQLPVLLPEDAEFRPTGESPSHLPRRVREHLLSRVWGPGTPGDRHHGHLHVLLLVLLKVRLPQLRRLGIQTRGDQALAARRPVHRRR